MVRNKSVRIVTVLHCYCCNLTATRLYLYILLVGRVHKASISDIDKERLFVSVEWFESGETKGKEVGAL